MSIQKWLICPISALREKFYPRNINYMPVVKFFARLDLDQIFLFLDGHYLVATSHEELIPFKGKYLLYVNSVSLNFIGEGRSRVAILREFNLRI